MTEHVHELILYYDHEIGDVLAICQGENCGWVYEQAEAESRLNATERFSAEDARNCLGKLRGTIQKTSAEALRAYANILEGK